MCFTQGLYWTQSYPLLGATLVTISIDELNRKRLLSIASDLQKKTGERVDFDEVISHITQHYESNQKRPDLWDIFTHPLPSVQFEELYREMIRERRRDSKLSTSS